MNDWLSAAWLQSWLPEVKSGLRITVILVAAWVAQAVLRRVLRRLRTLLATRAEGPEAAKRIETVGRALRYALTVAILLVAGMLVLNELGVSIAPILGAAGVVGLAIGFGAQSLIKDYFNGFFLLVENQIRVGDVVEIAGKGGLVEEITLRRVKLRGYDGAVHYVANGLITTVTNLSTEFAFAVMDISIAYKESIDAAMDVLRNVGAALRADPAFAPRILDELEIAGVDNLADSAVIIRCRLKVLPLEQWAVRRAFLKRTKEALDEAGIEIPFPHRTVFLGAAAPPAIERSVERAT
jgi:small conductance mechanosensitive channel